MQTFKILLVIGLIAAAFAVGLDYAWSALFGGEVTRDDIVRHVVVSFFIAITVVAMLRRKSPR